MDTNAVLNAISLDDVNFIPFVKNGHGKGTTLKRWAGPPPFGPF